jgi:hypothetical protein
MSIDVRLSSFFTMSPIASSSKASRVGSNLRTTQLQKRFALWSLGLNAISKQSDQCNLLKARCAQEHNVVLFLERSAFNAEAVDSRLMAVAAGADQDHQGVGELIQPPEVLIQRPKPPEMLILDTGISCMTILRFSKHFNVNAAGITA